MKVTLDWINQYLDRPASSVDELTAALERVGFPCESRETLPGGGVRLDFEVTSNRGDCVSIVGLAREFAAATGRTLRLPELTRGHDAAGAATVSAGAMTSVENRDFAQCPYYSARIIRGVKIGPSPQWLRDRIESIGLRAVNNVVDVTNLVLSELGQPLHAFDLGRLAEKRIIVRRAARQGEALVAIDGSKLTLDDSMLVIADSDRPVAIAGVMGGLESEVSATTTNVLLEAAVFSPASVRATSRRLKLMSDSSYRFERGIHPATVAFAADRAAELIAEIAGGERLAGAIVEGAEIPALRRVTLRLDRLRQVAGVDIPVQQVISILDRLGLNPSRSGDEVVCVIAAHRLDLEREIDLIEEVVRMYGFENIEPQPRLELEVAPVQADVVNRRRVDETLAACGFHEVVTFSFTSADDARLFLPPGFEILAVQDDRRKAEPVLQPSTLPGLLRCRKRNQDAGHRDVRLFERAACFCVRNGEKLEQSNLGLILDAPDRQHGVRAMRGALETVFRTINGPRATLTVRPTPLSWFDEDGGAVLLVNGELAGTMGVVRPDIVKRFDLQAPIVAAEIQLAPFENREAVARSVESIAAHPAIQRDLSVIVDEPIGWSKIEEAIAEVESSLLEGIEFVGVYRGRPVEPGSKSVTFRLVFRDPQRTLRHEEVDPVVAAIVERLSAEVGASLRE